MRIVNASGEGKDTKLFTDLPEEITAKLRASAVRIDMHAQRVSASIQCDGTTVDVDVAKEHCTVHVEMERLFVRFLHQIDGAGFVDKLGHPLESNLIYQRAVALYADDLAELKRPT